MGLNGKVAVVTGSGSGIGRAIALQLARDDAAISVWDLSKGGAFETVDLIADSGDQAIACVGDAASEENIKSFVDTTRRAFGPIAILVNNAGITGFKKFLDIGIEEWDRMMAINTRGPFLCRTEALRTQGEAR